ncbi:MAG: hypothetical protein M1587_04230 [Thaumarchaeota archaeon]|nr:hypothetical protein [Nitrososphaerota archaeon]
MKIARKLSKIAMWVAILLIAASVVALSSFSDAQTASQSTTTLQCTPPCTARTTYYTLTGSKPSLHIASVFSIGLVVVAILAITVSLIRSVELRR